LLAPIGPATIEDDPHASVAVERVGQGRTGMRSVIGASIDPEGPGSKFYPGRSCRSRDSLQEVELVENAAEAEDHAGGRIRGDLHRELRFLAEEPVEPS